MSSLAFTYCQLTELLSFTCIFPNSPVRRQNSLVFDGMKTTTCYKNMLVLTDAFIRISKIPPHVWRSISPCRSLKAQWRKLGLIHCGATMPPIQNIMLVLNKFFRAIQLFIVYDLYLSCNLDLVL